MCTSWGYICVCEAITDIKAIDVALPVNVSWHSFIITFCVGLCKDYPLGKLLSVQYSIVSSRRDAV